MAETHQELPGAVDDSDTLTKLYVSDLDDTLTEAELQFVFGQKGDVISVTLRPGKFFGQCGYVNFSNADDAEKAMKEFNFTAFKDKIIRISYSTHDGHVPRNAAANVFFKNLARSIDQRSFYEMACGFGKVISAKLETDMSGHSKGFGYVQYQTVEEARKAIDSLNGEIVGGEKVFADIWRNKAVRQQEALEMNGKKICIKNLDASINNEMLKELFAPFGTITAYRVYTEHGTSISKEVGFVIFSTVEEGSAAIAEMNDKLICGKNLHVCVCGAGETPMQPTVAHLTPTTSMHTVSNPMAPVVTPNQHVSLRPVIPFHQPGFGYQSQLMSRPYALFPAGPQLPDFGMQHGNLPFPFFSMMNPNMMSRGQNNANGFPQRYGTSNRKSRG